MTDTPKDFEELVEFRARTIYEEDLLRVSDEPGKRWDDLPDYSKQGYCGFARATLIAEWKAGIRPCTERNCPMSDFQCAMQSATDTIADLEARNAALIMTLQQCEEYFDQRADIADYSDETGHTPNEEMKMLTDIREVLQGN